MVIVWADGSCLKPGGPMGAGVLVEWTQDGVPWQRRQAHSLGNGTNNQAELWAIAKGLLAARGMGPILLRSDSQYSIGVLTQDWCIEKNVELVGYVRKIVAASDVTFEHVRGHKGILGNEIVDKLASLGSKQGMNLDSSGPAHTF